MHPDDKQLIDEKIRKSGQALEAKIEESVKGLTDHVEALRLRGFRLALSRVREWGTPVAVIAVLVTSIGIALAAGYQFWSRNEKEARFQERTNSRLSAIEVALLKLRSPQEKPLQLLNDLAALDQDAFNKALPVLRDVATRPVEEVRPPEALVREIGSKLKRTPQSAEDYWPTVVRFAHLATSSLNPDVPAPGPPWDVEIADQKFIIQDGFRYQHVTVRIANSTDITFKNSVFTKCRIRIEGNVSVRFQNSTFMNCAFEFKSNAPPSPGVERIARSLLESDFNRLGDTP